MLELLRIRNLALIEDMALDFGEGIGPGDFANVPQVRAWYNLNTLENNPKFAARVKQRARMGLIYKMGDP